MDKKSFLFKTKAFVKSPEFFLITNIFFIGIVLVVFFSIQSSVYDQSMLQVKYIEDDNFKLKESLRFPGTIEKIVVKANPVTENDNVALLRLKIENARILNFFLSDDMLSMPACGGGTMFTDTEICVDIASKSPLQKDQILGEIQLQWGFNAKGVLKGLEANAYYNLNSDKLSNYTIQPLEVSLFGGLSFTGSEIVYYCPMNYPFSESTKNCTNKYTGEYIRLLTQSELDNDLPKQEVKVSCSNGYKFDAIKRQCINNAGQAGFTEYTPGVAVLCEDYGFSRDCLVNSATKLYLAPLWKCSSSWCDPCNKQLWTCQGNDLYTCGYGRVSGKLTYNTPVKIKCSNGCANRACVGMSKPSEFKTIEFRLIKTPTPSIFPTPTGSTKLACGATGCNSDSDCVTGPPNYSCRKIDDVGKCILNCKSDEVRVTDCRCVSKSSTEKNGICGVIDVDGNGRLDYIDLAAFAKSYNINCTDTTVEITSKDPYSCGRKDTNGDSRIDYKDLANFATRYHTIKSSCNL